VELITKKFGQIIRQPDWKTFVAGHPDLMFKIHEGLAKLLNHRTRHSGY
jgi:hypothetical protein